MYVLYVSIRKNRTKELEEEKREEVNGGTDMMRPQLSLGKQRAASEQED